MFNGKSILALITARGGSKGIPGKNIIDLGGKPLLAWTIEAAQLSKYIDRLILSTDDNKIMEVAKNYNCEVPFIRPAELARDETPSMDVIIHALDALNAQYDYLLLLQPTSPFRTTVHIDSSIEFLFQQQSRMIVSVSEVKKDPSLMFYKAADQTLEPILSGVQPTRRQDVRPAFAHNGAIYFSEVEYLRSAKSYKTPEVKGFELHGFIDIDIDETSDLEYARWIYENKKINI